MLLKIREKSQGVFAWIILAAVCVTFALFGINNYVGGASENSIATVGDKEFFQSDVTQAYQQYSRNFQGMNIDEETIKRQSLIKLIKDEVLLQHVQDEGLVVTDEDARTYIASLEYFQVDGKFDKKQYESILGSQRISSPQFVGRIKRAQIMEQYQRAVTDSSFTTQYDIDNFFKIQNQQRDIDYVTLAVTPSEEQPSEEAINAYYQKQQQNYQTVEQVSIEYITLSLDDLAKEIEVTDEALQAFYEEQKDLYTKKERRKISHILFAFTKETDEAAALIKAQAAQKQLTDKTFEVLAAEVSDDQVTAKKGGDLGLFEIGVMEKSFEEAASQLALNEISAPVKSAYGYHLIKVTELVAGEIKSFDTVKAEVSKSYQRKQAENSFFETAERLTEVSYENPDSLAAAADSIGVDIQKSSLFTRAAGEGITKEDIVRNNAFSEDVLRGNNSDLIELKDDKAIVLRMLEHRPAATRPLDEVKADIIIALLNEKAQKDITEKATALKKQLLAGKTIQALATENNLEVKSIAGLTRSNGDVSWQINQAAFKAAKPRDDKASIFTIALPKGEQAIVSLTKVTDGVMSKSDKKQQKLAEMNIAKALSQSLFGAVINSLQSRTDVTLKSTTAQEE